MKRFHISWLKKVIALATECKADRQGVALSELKQVTQAPEVSKEHIVALAKMCNVIGAYTTAEWVDAIVGFVRVVLNDNAVQGAFVRANSAILSRASSSRAEVERDAYLLALQRIADMRDRDGNAIEMHREELRGIARTALRANK
jgi:hypothetical protein